MAKPDPRTPLKSQHSVHNNLEFTQELKRSLSLYKHENPEVSGPAVEFMQTAVRLEGYAPALLDLAVDGGVGLEAAKALNQYAHLYWRYTEHS